jgi:hypothetical protein
VLGNLYTELLQRHDQGVFHMHRLARGLLIMLRRDEIVAKLSDDFGQFRADWCLVE